MLKLLWVFVHEANILRFANRLYLTISFILRFLEAFMHFVSHWRGAVVLLERLHSVTIRLVRFNVPLSHSVLVGFEWNGFILANWWHFVHHFDSYEIFSEVDFDVLLLIVTLDFGFLSHPGFHILILIWTWLRFPLFLHNDCIRWSYSGLL